MQKRYPNDCIFLCTATHQQVTILMLPWDLISKQSWKIKIVEGYGFCPAPWNAGSNTFAGPDMLHIIVNLFLQVKIL